MADTEAPYPRWQAPGHESIPDEVKVWRRLPGNIHAVQLTLRPWGAGGQKQPWVPQPTSANHDSADPETIGAEYLRLRSAGFSIEEAVEKAYA
jgi:hypothetical protein